jgi:hypothetical protein
MPKVHANPCRRFKCAPLCMCRSFVAVTWRTQLGQLQLVACNRFSVIPGCGRWTHKGLEHEGDSTKGCAFTAAEDSDEESEAFPGTDAGSGCGAVNFSQGIDPQDLGNALLGSVIQKGDLFNGECSSGVMFIIFSILSGEIWVDNPRQYGSHPIHGCSSGDADAGGGCGGAAAAGHDASAPDLDAVIDTWQRSSILVGMHPDQARSISPDIKSREACMCQKGCHGNSSRKARRHWMHNFWSVNMHCILCSQLASVLQPPRMQRP